MTGFVTFMNATFGRTLRLLLGIVLIIYGLLLLGGTVGTVVALVSLLPCCRSRLCCRADRYKVGGRGVLDGSATHASTGRNAAAGDPADAVPTHYVLERG